MNTSKADLEAVPAWALAELRQARVAHLATADQQGKPLVIPICFAQADATIYTAIDGKPKRTSRLRRLRNIEVNPQVALVVDHYDEDWQQLWYVLVRGRAGLVEDAETWRRAADLLVKKYEQYQSLKLDEGTPILSLTVERISSWRFETRLSG